MTAKDLEKDSPLWTQHASTAEPFGQLEIPENLTEIAAQVARDLSSEIKKRVQPYETPVSEEALTKPLG